MKNYCFGVVTLVMKLKGLRYTVYIVSWKLVSVGAAVCQQFKNIFFCSNRLVLGTELSVML